jgi:hypothetical protein
MAKKKSKRPNLPQETLERARAELHGDTQVPVTVAESSGSDGAAVAAAAKPKVAAKRPGTSLATRRIPSISELIQEYSYVLRDLRYLTILATLLFVAIIVAALVLPRPLG